MHHYTMHMIYYQHRQLLECIVQLLSDRSAKKYGAVEFIKVKSHSGVIGNERADAAARAAAKGTIDMDLSSMPLPSTRRHSFWLYGKRTGAARAAATQPDGTQDNNATQPVHAHVAGSHTRELGDLRGALRQHMHAHHKLGGANTDSVYYRSWAQTTCMADGTLSNACTHPGTLPPGHLRTLLRWRTGTLWNQKLAHRYRMAPSSACPLCHEEDGGMHIASGCQHPTMQCMYTERHNIVGRCLLKAIQKGSKGACIVSADVGSKERCEDEGVHWVGCTNVPDCMLAPLPCTGPARADEERPINTRPDIMLHVKGNTRQDDVIYIVEIKTCRDTDVQRQLSNATAQHGGLLERLQTAGYRAVNIMIVPFLIGVSGTIYTEHTLAAMEKLGVDSERARKCARKIHALMADQMHSIVINRRRLEHS